MTNQQPTGGFAKAFVPGLVLGIVIGAFAGATLPALLSEKKLPEHTGVIPNGARTDREREALPPEAVTDPGPDPTQDAPPEDDAEQPDQTPPADGGGAADDGDG